MYFFLTLKQHFITFFPDINLEKNAVIDPRICVEGGEGELPDFLLNEFSFYDKEGHMVALDANLIESGKEKSYW